MSLDGQQPEIQHTGRIGTTEPQSSRAMIKALEVLTSVIEPYLPLDRRPGRFIFEGVEAVVQSEEGKPFNNIGSIFMAARLLQRWEKSIGDNMKARIESLDPVRGEAGATLNTESGTVSEHATPKQLFDATLPHQPLSQPIAYALTLPKEKRNFTKHVVLGQGMTFIKEAYLRKLELENHVYRRHLGNLEKRLYENALQDVSNVLGLQNESKAVADISAKKIHGLVTPRENRVVPKPQARQPKAQPPLAKNIGKLRIQGSASAPAKASIGAPSPSLKSVAQPKKRKTWAQPAVQPVSKRQELESAARHEKGNAPVSSAKQKEMPQTKPGPVIIDLSEEQDEKSESEASNPTGEE